MKMVTNKHIIDSVTELLGDDALKVVLYLKDKKRVSEFDVAKLLKVDINEARAILYRLYEHNLVLFERDKDKKKGWYITFWDYAEDNIKHFYKKYHQEKLDKLKERLKNEEKNDYYICANACVRMDFDKASEISFKCPECGSLLNPMDNKRTKEFINERIKEIEKLAEGG
jgi:transcription initiation factor TFIIE subunit alpha